ncbi:MAG: hypothetical protein IJ071_11495 [Ruminococcus sp.]|nr:hypothetical protein [Ruminococcus sp.]
MRYRSISLFALIIAAAPLLFGCSGSKTVSSAVDPEPVTPQSIVFDWQEPYKNKLDEFMASDQFKAQGSGGVGASMFDLRDLTGDNIPELMISPDTDHGTPCQIYTCSGGALSSLGETGDYGMFRFLPALGLVSDEYQGTGFTIGKYLGFENGELVPVVTYSDNTASAATGAIIVHEINGEEVSLPEFDAALEEYRSSPSCNMGRKYTFGEKAVDYAVYCSESWGAVLTPSQKQQYRLLLSSEYEAAQQTGTDVAFELCDLNADDMPELIISEGTFDGASCKIYYINNDEVSQLDGNYGSDGRLGLDIAQSVFYAYGASENTYWSLTDSSFSAAGYTASDSTMECGRKFLLSPDTIEAALN